MEPWYKVVTPRTEVREGRSFNPDEFAIHLEQVVARTAPEDYRNPAQFFARTCWTRALREHTGMVRRRLAGRTDNTSPVLTLITQFGGGKTHTLTSLYHLAQSGPGASEFNRHRHSRRAVSCEGPGRGHRRAAEGHSPPGRGHHPVRVVGGAD
jgi:predicted AAA+ superfamily ATPase